MQPLALPTHNWHDWLTGRVDGLLHEARTLLDTIKDGATRSMIDILDLWNDADLALRNADSVAGLLREVHPDADRDRVLAAGGAKDAQELICDFLGRPFSFDAFGEWLDREPVAIRS